MASATIRSPLQAPTPSDQLSHFDTPNISSTASCPFRRSRSRVFYDSQHTTGTSWEFRGIDSPPLYHTQMHLSILRSPQVLQGPSDNHGLSSPSPMMVADSSTTGHHRSIPSPPTKDDLSDGSRNSTGSSTGSHRSQDSGFSDSGEARPPRRSLTIVSSPHLQHLSNSPSLQLQHNQIMAAVSRVNNSNSGLGDYCGDVNLLDTNANKTSSSPIGVVQFQRNSTSGGRNFVTFAQSHNGIHSHHYQDVQSIYSPHSNYDHQQELYYSTPVPSPIPHTGSGCGKLTIHRNAGSTFTLPLKSQPVPCTPHAVGEYGEINGNTGEANCSNCVYQEIVLCQHQHEYQHRPQVPSSVTFNASQQYHHLQLHHHSNQNRSIRDDPGNYALIYSTISPSTEPNGHLGTPMSSSTPKRSNLSVSAPSTRAAVMQKIDNFESLNKNKRSLDNNNNSSNSNSPANFSSPPSSSKEVKNSPRNLNHQFSSPHHHSPIPPPGNTSSCSFHQERNNGNSSIKSSKKHSKLSFLSSSSSSQNQIPHNSPTTSGISDCSRNGNKTVVQRGPLPLPPVLETPSSIPTTTAHVENDNSFTPNELSTYASHSQLKSCFKISPKWKSLPNGYKRVSTRDLASSYTSEPGLTSSPDGVIVVRSHFDNDAMKLWLHELRSQTENECFYMLQTKSIISSEEDAIRPSDKGSQIITTNVVTASDSDSGTYGSQESGSLSEANKKEKLGKSVVEAIHNISSPLMSIKNVEQMANVVSGEFAKICKNIEFGFMSQVPRLVLNLVNYVEEFLRTFASTSMFGNLQKLENKLSRSCRRLNRSAQLMIEISGISKYEQPTSVHSIIESENMKKGEGYHVAVSEVVDGIVTVGNLFSQVVDLRLTRDLSCILDTVEGGGVPAKVALKAFATILMDGGNHLCRLASEIRTVRGMLGVILDAKDDYLRILSLRCLATVLCVGEAVKDFDRASGFEIVADFMYDPMYSFDLKIEAVSVFTQATDPWIDLETSLCTLSSNLEKIVVALTNLIPACKSSEEPFLLVVAAISNLTFLEVSSVEIFRKCNTIAFILNVINTTGCNFSVFVLDHVATILANMAGVESCRDCIVQSGGILSLLNFLHKRSTPSLESAAEIMACERVQQKSTIAISRLCSEEGVAKIIMERGGLHRLIQLSRNEKERNYSDGVLIAALATLRKLVSICGDETIRGLEADDLIQPRLLDSFLLYSSRQESYV